MVSYYRALSVLRYIACDNELIVLSKEHAVTDTHEQTVKRIKFLSDGKIKLEFELKNSTTSYYAFAYIYRNNKYIAFKNTLSTTYEKKELELDVKENDIIEIRVRHSVEGETVYLRNLKVKGAYLPIGDVLD